MNCGFDGASGRHVLDLTAHEQRRLAAVLEAMPGLDPGAVLAAEARRIFVQCPRCWARWWHDTGFGVGDRPRQLNDPLMLSDVA